MARASRGASSSGVLLGVLAGIVLFVLFVAIGFPYHLIAGRLVGELERVLGAEVELGRVGPGLGLTGPRLSARDVRVRFDGGEGLAFERLRLRPAWSLSWFRAQPAVRIWLDAERGGIDGTLWLGSSETFAGRVRDFDLEALPVETWRPGVDLGGILDGSFELARSGAAVVGASRFEARDGLVGLPALPLAVPYAELRGELRLAENGALEVSAVELEGPMVGLTLEGSVGPAADFAQAPLRLTGRLSVPDESLRQAFAAPGLRFGPDAIADFRIAGTVAAPSLR